MTETTLFMRIQNIKNGAQYTDGSFHYSLFFSPLLLLRSFPTECICSNTINVTFADCLLAFYLNGIQLRLAAAATNALAGGCDSQSRPAGSGPARPRLGEQGSPGPNPPGRGAGVRGGLRGARRGARCVLARVTFAASARGKRFWTARTLRSRGSVAPTPHTPFPPRGNTQRH